MAKKSLKWYPLSNLKETLFTELELQAITLLRMNVRICFFINLPGTTYAYDFFEKSLVNWNHCLLSLVYKKA